MVRNFKFCWKSYAQLNAIGISKTDFYSVKKLKDRNLENKSLSQETENKTSR